MVKSLVATSLKVKVNTILVAPSSKAADGDIETVTDGSILSTKGSVERS
ncbi:MAG: hypothetical protein IPF54_11595 [Draconibacterium sp.]|nr:hypothetical protein [Draconibacterium sp.]